MSAVAGCYHRDGRPLDRADLTQMVATLAHRGPDGSGLWVEGPVGLGHRLLWTTRESLNEQLPHIDPHANFVVTADARIDNRAELIASLSLRVPSDGSIPDSTLILEAYRRWGENCPERLLGDFVFAIWDGRKRQLFCARDRMGVRPLYYYQSPDLFVFASEIKGLLCFPQVPRRLDETRVADYLAETLFDRTATFYRDLLRLPPAHCITVGPETVQLRQYWRLDPASEIRRGSDRAFEEEFRSLFEEAVGCRLRSAFPVGSLLSGGLDSSSITCTARQHLAGRPERRLHTFSAVYPDLRVCDERPFIDAVLEQGGMEPHYVTPAHSDPLADIDRVLWHQDEPVWWPTWSMERALYSAAREQGVRALLDGTGGDQAISHGDLYLPDLARAARWSILSRELSAISFRRREPSPQVAWREVVKPLLRNIVPRRVLQLRQRVKGGSGLHRNAIINADFDHRIGFTERVRAQSALSLRQQQTARGYHHSTIDNGLVYFGLEMGDKNGFLFSLRKSYPFYDSRVLEFCLALPGDQKVRDGVTRSILRRAMNGVLPREVQHRESKAYFDPLLNRGLIAHRHSMLDQIMENDLRAAEPWVDVPAARSLYQSFVGLGESGVATLAHARSARQLLVVAVLARWIARTGITT